jgi:hypothetical protein
MIKTNIIKNNYFFLRINTVFRVLSHFLIIHLQNPWSDYRLLNYNKLFYGMLTKKEFVMNNSKVLFAIIAMSISSIAIVEAAAVEKWDCAKCTFENTESSMFCEICGGQAVSPKKQQHRNRRISFLDGIGPETVTKEDLRGKSEGSYDPAATVVKKTPASRMHPQKKAVDLDDDSPDEERGEGTCTHCKCVMQVPSNLIGQRIECMQPKCAAKGKMIFVKSNKKTAASLKRAGEGTCTLCKTSIQVPSNLIGKEISCMQSKCAAKGGIVLIS